MSSSDKIMSSIVVSEVGTPVWVGSSVDVKMLVNVFSVIAGVCVNGMSLCEREHPTVLKSMDETRSDIRVFLADKIFDLLKYA